LMARLLSIPEYQTLFADAFPGETLGFQHAAIAIAAFEAEAYTFLDSPWDNYVAGNNQALSAAEKRGALLFFGKAKCANCHSGSLLTDQDHHNIGVPQFGPGKGAEAPLDHGRGRETGDPLDLFRFRTPPLRNCEVTGPYMHNGAYNDLEDVVRHHASPLVSLLTYDPDEQLGQVELRDTYSLFDQLSMAWTIESSKLPRRLSKKKVRDLVRFLKTLTAPNIQNRMDATLPLTVPSGLPVDGVPTTP
jgi:cytochrome c peroxidase